MATFPETIPEVDKKKRNLVEMNWDPITRIVGSLGGVASSAGVDGWDGVGSEHARATGVGHDRQAIALDLNSG